MGQATSTAAGRLAAPAHWRERLERHRAELLREPPRPDRELADDRERVLRLIDRALAKLDGRLDLPYGVCEITREPIAPERLELMPWTPVSIAGATELEERFLTIDDLLTDGP
jgi:RNA polymerase-binding transcription factor DksA